MATHRTLEQELKLEAEPGFVLPEMPGEPRPERIFESLYFDTADARLRRAGMTLRRRLEQGKGVWQLKLPCEGARLEVEVNGGEKPPRKIVRALGSVLRGGTLEQVALLRTRRTPFSVSANGTELAEVAIDEVEILTGGDEKGGVFSQLEVELKEGTGKDLEKIAKRLRKAGARNASQTPKLDRALGTPTEPATEFGRVIAAQVRALLTHDVGLRLAPVPEDVHQLRVAMRRLRAYLRVARPVLDEPWSEPLRDELQELGRMLGEARDLDVLIEHLDAEVPQLDEPGSAALVARLHIEREALQPALLASLSGKRWRGLLDRLEQEPPIREGPGLGPLAKAERKRLRKREVATDAPDDDLHDLRKRVKRARYASELAGEDTVVDRAKEVQDILGEHQDAAFAEEKLRAFADGESGLAAGRLVERQRERRRRARDEYPRAWKRLRDVL